MKQLFLKLALTCLLLINTNCAQHFDDGAVNPSRTFDLGWYEKRKLKKAALDGDGEAAFRVAQYYLFLVQDRTAQIYWLRVGSKIGNKSAKYSLADLLIKEHWPENLAEAERLLFELETSDHDPAEIKALKYLREDLEKQKQAKN